MHGSYPYAIKNQGKERHAVLYGPSLHLSEENSVLRLVALDGRDKPGLVAGRGRGRGRRPAVLLLLLSLLGRRLACDGAVPLGNPPEIEEKIPSQPLLVVGDLALEQQLGWNGSDGN